MARETVDMYEYYTFLLITTITLALPSLDKNLQMVFQIRTSFYVAWHATTLKLNDDISSRQKVVTSNRVGNKQPRANEFLSNQEAVSTQIALVTRTEGGASLHSWKLMTSADYFSPQCYADFYDRATTKREMFPKVQSDLNCVCTF